MRLQPRPGQKLAARPLRSRLPEAPPDLLPGLTRSGEDANVRYFEEDGAGNLQQLPDSDYFAKTLGKMDDGNFHEEFRGGVMELIGGLKKEGTLSGMGMDLDAFLKRLETRTRGAKTREGLYKALDEYARELEEKLEREGDPLSAFDTEDVDKLDLDPQTRLEIQESRALRNSPIPQIPEQTWTKSQRRQVAQLNSTLR